jgi:hypothetical protein
MGQNEFGVRDGLLTEEQEIDINAARPPAF